MVISTAKLTAKYQITLPAEIRRRLSNDRDLKKKVTEIPVRALDDLP